MTYLEQRKYEDVPSARERIASKRAEAKTFLTHCEEMLEKATGETQHVVANSRLIQATDRLFILDVANILLDAMRDGPDARHVKEVHPGPVGNKS